ncbi:DUF5689 domain-containing protein [Hallella seregens]|uniref:DUF5689 domain-containing protein n=1 Tax=Hallella seregens ATCC 51272 TaxID=1336250 RepID=A0ABV5ZKI2_9BACT|nr:DUF5689 domain-containing protein [Hallella seregens]
MKTFHHIMVLALVCCVATGCMDGDWDAQQPTAEQAGVGNKDIDESNIITIAELKDRYKTAITTDYRDGKAYAQVAEDTKIKAVVTGNDIQGNLYNELAVADATGGIVIAVAEGGLFGTLPVGAEIIIDLKGLYVGNYGLQAEIGTPYTNASGATYVSRMSRALWNQHFRLTGKTQTMEPVAFDKNWKPANDGLTYGGRLVKLTNVSLKGADGKATYATPGGGGGSKSVYFNELGNSVMLYTSNYADFAANPLPTGKINVTGIMKRYNRTWEIIIRTLDDVEEVK